MSIVYTCPPDDGLPRREQARVKKLRKEAFARQGGLCHWCGKPMIWKNGENSNEVWDHPDVCTADHVLWKSRGGLTTRDNIVAACRKCNNNRHAPVSDWPWLNELVKPLLSQQGLGPWPVRKSKQY